MAIEIHEFALNANTLVEGQQCIERIFDVRTQQRISEFVGGEYSLYRVPATDVESVESGCCAVARLGARSYEVRLVLWDERLKNLFARFVPH